MTSRKKEERNKGERDRQNESIQPKAARSRSDHKASGRESHMQLSVANRANLKHMHAINEYSLHASFMSMGRVTASCKLIAGSQLNASFLKYVRLPLCVLPALLHELLEPLG